MKNETKNKAENQVQEIENENLYEIVIPVKGENNKEPADFKGEWAYQIKGNLGAENHAKMNHILKGLQARQKKLPKLKAYLENRKIQRGLSKQRCFTQGYMAEEIAKKLNPENVVAIRECENVFNGVWDYVRNHTETEIQELMGVTKVMELEPDKKVKDNV